MNPELKARIIEDQELVFREFTKDKYRCEMHIWNDNTAHIKWGKRSIFGWIELFDGDRHVCKLAYSVAVSLNDWDLSPRYVEFGLLAKLEVLMNELHPSPHGRTLLELVSEL